MPKTNSSIFLRSVITVALSVAAIGSFRLAQATTSTKAFKTEPLKLAKEIGNWKAIESASDLSKPDVVARKFISKDGAIVGVVVRSNPSNAVLHDLSSCLINAQAKPVVERDEQMQLQSGTLTTSLISFELKKVKKLGLLWFQHGDKTASNRWTWRLISSTTPSVRDAPIFYQVEVTTKASENTASDIASLRAMSGHMYEALLHR